MPIPADLLSLAGEYAVASQLTRMRHYAQLTFGNRKRTDILVDAANGSLFRVEVKSKQNREWPRVQAPVDGDFVVLVDFCDKSESELPDFYILNYKDWVALVEAYRAHHPKIHVDEAYCVRHPDGWTGLNVKVEWVKEHRGKWKKMPGTVSDDENG